MDVQADPCRITYHAHASQRFLDARQRPVGHGEADPLPQGLQVVLLRLDVRVRPHEGLQVSREPVHVEILEQNDDEVLRVLVHHFVVGSVELLHAPRGRDVPPGIGDCGVGITFSALQVRMDVHA